jgi:hypothetical protein
VEGWAVELDDDSLLAPDEVGLEAAEFDVGVGERQPGVADQSQQRVLGPRAADRHRGLIAYDVAEPGGAATWAVARRRADP